MMILRVVMAGQKRVEDARERAYARPSTSLVLQGFEDVDARDKRGHDGHQVMPPL
jgi:hypothetical protein